MAINIIELFGLIKELVSNSEKMEKFKEIIFDLKELISDFKDVVSIIKG